MRTSTRLYREMKNLPNDDQRAELIKQMVAIVEHERPWIELYHNEDYTLSHAWLVNSKPMGISNPLFKYKDVKPRAAGHGCARNGTHPCAGPCTSCCC